MPEKTYEELQAERDTLQAKLDAANAASTEILKVRASETARLASDRAQADEALAQRVAEILASKMQGPRVYGTSIGQPARIVGHKTLRCKNCGHTRPADAQADSKNPSAGGCGGQVGVSHDFHGMDTVIENVDALMPHHAVYIEGTAPFLA